MSYYAEADILVEPSTLGALEVIPTSPLIWAQIGRAADLQEQQRTITAPAEPAKRAKDSGRGFRPMSFDLDSTGASTRDRSVVHCWVWTV